MPEGDTIYLAATTLRKALLGKRIVRFETAVGQVAAVHAATPVTGRIVTAVEPRGKHLLITFSSHEDESTGTPNTQHPTPDLVLHTHMRMTGSWHIYRPGEPWQKPARMARVVLHTDDFVAPCFNAPVVELLTQREAERHPDLVTLGPDAITPGFDLEEAFRRIRRRAEVPIGVALLDQRAMAGVGNIYKSETLFIQRVSPFATVGELSDETLRGLIEEAHRLLRLNRERGSRRTMFGLNDRQRLWVYGRSGEPCRECGETIRMRRQGMDARSTYYCPRCQNAPRT
jgi:endonuclease VIII